MAGALLALLLATAPGPAASSADRESRIGQSARAAQALQGSLDGAWILSDAAGRPLYAFQISDPPGGAGCLEGAWRDLRSAAPASAVGVIGDIRLARGRVRIRFAPGARMTVVLLRGGPLDRWRGRMERNGVSAEVSMISGDTR